MKGFSGFGSPVKQRKKDALKTSTTKITAPKGSGAAKAVDVMKLGPLKPGFLGGGYTEKGKAVNYINKANKFKAKFNPKTAGPGSMQKATAKRKFSKKARSVGIKKGFGSTLSKFFGKRLFGPIGFLGGTLGTGLTTQASNKGRTKMTSKQMKEVNTQLQKTIYEGNKKRYK